MDKEKYLKKLSEFKKLLGEKLSINHMILFGSRARGNFREDSDFDLIVVSDAFEGEKSFRRAIGFYEYWNIDSPVDFICLTNEELEKKRKEVGIISQALKEGVIIK